MQSTGKRAKKLIIDDLLKDDSESYNKELHSRMVNRYDSTWTSRADDDNLKVLLLGTMWAPTDLLNVVYDRALQDDKLMPSTKYKYCEETKSGKSVFIGVPALDEREQSTCPKRYSSESLRKKRDNMSKFLWMCVYQQNPIAPEGLEFDYSNLKQYDEIPVNTEARYATLDPARRGKNYVSMPILYRVKGETNQFVLVDFLYRKKSMKELYDDIVEKIIEHRLNYLLVENNTDTSLKMVIETKLHDKGYFGCTIEEKYSTENKEQRIKDNQGYVRGNITYPRKGMYPPNTDMGMAMESITSYSFDYPNKFDDAIDSIVLFVMKYIDKVDKFQRVKTFNRKQLGI
jgi:predicted phage terminase large subunit-like protein